MSKRVSYYDASSSTLLFIHKNLNANVAINSVFTNEFWIHCWQVSGIQMNMTYK